MTLIDDIWAPKQSPKVTLDRSGKGLRDASGQKRDISNPHSIYYVLSMSPLPQPMISGHLGTQLLQKSRQKSIP